MPLIRKMRDGDRIALLDTQTGTLLHEQPYQWRLPGRTERLWHGVEATHGPQRKLTFRCSDDVRVLVSPLARGNG